MLIKKQVDLKNEKGPQIDSEHKVLDQDLPVKPKKKGAGKKESIKK